MSALVVFEFPPPAPLLSMNDRGHWRTRSTRTKEWRTMTAYAALGTRQRNLPPGIVAVELPVRDNRRRDPHNYFATVKPIVDGLVDASFWPDDTPEWVTTVEPRLWRGTTVRVVVTER